MLELTVDNVINRLKQVPNGSRALDGDIELLLYPIEVGENCERDGLLRGRFHFIEQGKFYESPYYTTSLDAAKQLLPVGWQASVALYGRAVVWPEDDMWVDHNPLPPDNDIFEAATPELALAAAGLGAHKAIMRHKALDELAKLGQEIGEYGR